MKKIGLIIFSVVMAIAMIGCTSKNVKARDLPSQDKIKGIEIKNSNSKNGVIINNGTAFKKVLKIINNALKEGDGNGRESVNETPVDVNEYLTVSILSDDDNSDKYYFYKENGRLYMECPYAGIWEISDEIYNKIKQFDG